MKTTLEALQQDIRLLKSENHGLKKEIANMRKNGHLHSEICDAIVGMNEEGMDEDLAKLLYHKRFLIPPKGTTIPPRGTTESVKTTSASNTETPKAAFSAFLNNPIDWSTSGKQFTAVFDSVVSNVGGAYDPTTGIFTAQTKGTYYFSSAVKSDGHHFNEIYLITNNDIVCSWDKGADESGSVATVITLDAGERVYVQHYLWRKDYSNIWYSASFTGFQI
ncbi:complement C1q-like protein 2 [Mercenaria mercenaria]|uniref:complement C1q-like protein 2 n=1 Tax=Mercenaria mercenaria TaxID=6596 RepID=UPI00234F5CA8|nr:complement C1q-like protein 2 [Mercenaria mercenaria]